MGLNARRPASAAYRIALLYAAAFAAAVLALGAAAYIAADAQFRRQQDVGIRLEADELVRDYDAEGIAELRRDVGRRDVGRGGAPLGYEVFDAAGGRLAGRLGLGPLPPGWHDVDVAPAGRGSDAGRALAVRLRGGETLVVALDTDALEKVDRTLLALLSAAFVGVAAIGIAGALLLARFLGRRLERIGDTAAAIAGGDMGRRVPVGRRHDEFDRLGLAVNAMLDRIAGLLENLRQVSTGVAHDLRTPLAKVRAGLEAVADADDPEQLRTAVGKAIVGADDVLALFGAILRIAEVERGGAAVTGAPVDLAEVAGYLFEAYAPAVVDGGRTLDLDAPGPVHVRADRALLSQAIANLLDNAQTHTPPGTGITLSAGVENGAGFLRVSDDGPGVPAADRERVTRRFVRLERSRTTPGHGLGLSMVAAIAHAHGGSLRLDDAAPGLRATIALPGARSGAPPP